MGTRAYRSPVRERRAAQTRSRVLDAAADGFTRRGFAGTTLAGIAAEAGVSIDSVVAVGSKSFLLLESFRRRYAGDGGWRSILDQPTIQEMFALTDREQALDAITDFLATGHRASADLWFVVRATALFEPVVAEGIAELLELKRQSFAVTVDWLIEVGLVPAVTSEAERQSLAANVNVLMSAETYVLATTDWQYSDEDYRQWVRRMIPQLRP